MANVITYGTFDLFHVGHLRLLQRARSVVQKNFFTMGADPIVFTIVFKKYLDEAAKISNLVIGGRLGQYKYFDMDKSIQAALKLKLEV